MKNVILIFLLFIFSSMKPKPKIDLLIYNATVYTVDQNFSKVEAIAVNHGKIVATGSSQNLMNEFDALEKINAKGKFIFPGFIDAHSHFFGYGCGEWLAGPARILPK